MIKKKFFKSILFMVLVIIISMSCISINPNAKKLTLPNASVDNYNIDDSVGYNWFDAKSGGTEITTLSDDDYETISLPFSFTFYDQTFTSIHVGSNGILSFQNGITTWNEQLFPNIDFDYSIALLWDDLNPTSGASEIYYKSFTNKFVISYINIAHYGGTLQGTFQLVLYNTGRIVFQYESIDYMSGYTCGLNYGDGVYGNSYTGLSTSTSNLAIQFDNPSSINLEPIITPLADLEIEYGSTGLNLEWAISDDTVSGPYYDIYVNNTFNMTDTWNPISSPAEWSLDDLQLNFEYNVRIDFYDGYGASASDEVLVTVVNGLPARFLPPPPDRTFGPFINELVNISWTIVDFNYGTTEYNVTKDGEIIKTGSWNHGDQINVTLNTTQFDDASYEYKIIANDGVSGLSEDVVIITKIWNPVPIIAGPSEIVYSVNATNNIAEYYLVDFNSSALTYTITLDGSQVKSGVWESGEYISYNCDGFGIGSHTLIITALDGKGKSSQLSTDITIVGNFLTDNPNFQEKIDYPPEFEEEPDSPIDPLLIVGISLGAAGALAAGLIYKKKKG